MIDIKTANLAIKREMAREVEKEELEEYRNRTMKELKDKEVYGGFEGKYENGELIYFKHWISRKRKIK